ncbi:hypothetical protein ACQRIT_000793 [Beauveria bassiana]
MSAALLVSAGASFQKGKASANTDSLDSYLETNLYPSGPSNHLKKLSCPGRNDQAAKITIPCGKNLCLQY